MRGGSDSVRGGGDCEVTNCEEVRGGGDSVR